MKTTLITPPHFYLFNALAVSRLTAYLKAQGHNVKQIDVDMEICDHLFQEEELRRTFERIDKALLPRLNKNGDLADNSASIWSKVSQTVNMTGAEYKDFSDFIDDQNKVIENVKCSVNQLSTKYFGLGRERFFAHLMSLNVGMLLTSLAHYPTLWTPLNGISMKYSPHVIGDILVAIQDEEQNFLIDYYRRYIIPRIIESKPHLIGVSLNHFSQFIPGFTLAGLIKEDLPDCHINIGGAALTLISRFLMKGDGLWPLFDSATVGIGEYTLDGLIYALSDGKSLSRVPNLIYKKDSEIGTSEVKKMANMDDFPTPEFVENRPNSIIPIAASTGCSWGKCVFCHYPYIHYNDKDSPPYLMRSLDKVIDDLEQLNEEYHPLYFHFTDTNIIPDRLEGIADRILARGIKVRFFSFMRAEEPFTSLSFCEKLAKAGYIGGYFGLESAARNTNPRMNKNIDLSHIPEILKNFNRAGIIPNLFCMVGFPNETEEEAWETYHFIKDNMDILKGEISINGFNLEYNTPIFRHPERFGIKRVIQNENLDFNTCFDYEVTNGLTQAQTWKLVNRFNKELGLDYIGTRFISELLRRVER